MKLALMQAQRNLGNTKENPAVGCVIVKNDCIISAGCTGINGRPHAEQNAITYSKNDIPTSTVGKFIMEGLANLDQVAYVRFASVYRNFKEAKDFEQFIGNLNVYKAE